MSKLVMIGHSMGGITAIEATRRFDEIKSCVTMDPYFEPVADLIAKGEYFINKKPMCIISTALFHKSKLVNEFFDSTATLKKFYELSQENNPSKLYNLTLKGSDHLNQCDMTLMLEPVLKLFGNIPWSCDSKTIVLGNNQTIISFLVEIGVLQSEPSSTEIKHIPGIEKV